jgi:hypothetical protein
VSRRPKKRPYSTRSCVNWGLYGTRGPLKSSCHKETNLHTNSLNNILGVFWKNLKNPSDSIIPYIDIAKLKTKYGKYLN